MKTKKIKISEIVIDAGTQQREKINEEIIEEYSDAMKCGAQFPPVTVFFNSVEYYLADGFHRFLACKSAGIDEITADIHEGTKRDAILHSFSVNSAHGLRRTNSDKRKSVVGMLTDDVWMEWTNRDIAKHVGVSHTYVNKLRDQLEDGESGNVSTPNQKPVVSGNSGNVSRDNEENHEEFDPKEHELQEAHDTISHLADENTKLRDALAAGQLPEDEIISAEETITGLRKQVKSLEAEIDAVKSSRDIYQTENAQLKQQCRMYANKLKAFIS